jgi:hypothetical protein
MRTGADAIETKCAVKIPGLAREIKVHFATALSGVSTQAIMGFAAGANSSFADFNFER